MRIGTAPHEPLDLEPYGLRLQIGAGPEWARRDIARLIEEVIASRAERNRVARECAEQRGRADDAEARVALLEPVADAALIHDDADAADDDLEIRDTNTRAELFVAAATLRNACENYRAGLNTNAAEA